MNFVSVLPYTANPLCEITLMRSLMTVDLVALIKQIIQVLLFFLLFCFSLLCFCLGLRGRGGRWHCFPQCENSSHLSIPEVWWSLSHLVLSEPLRRSKSKIFLSVNTYKCFKIIKSYWVSDTCIKMKKSLNKKHVWQWMWDLKLNYTNFLFKVNIVSSGLLN